MGSQLGYLSASSPRCRTCDAPRLHRNAPLTYTAHPEMLFLHRYEGYKAKLEPSTRLGLNHRCYMNAINNSPVLPHHDVARTIIAARTDARSRIAVRVNLGRAADYEIVTQISATVLTSHEGGYAQKIGKQKMKSMMVMVGESK